MADESQDLKRKAIHSTAWYGLNRFVTQFVSWAITLVLARILVPSDYGLFAMAVAVIQANITARDAQAGHQSSRPADQKRATPAKTIPMLSRKIKRRMSLGFIFLILSNWIE